MHQNGEFGEISQTLKYVQKLGTQAQTQADNTKTYMSPAT